MLPTTELLPATSGPCMDEVHYSAPNTPSTEL
jgi:hypothetical protein